MISGLISFDKFIISYPHGHPLKKPILSYKTT